MAIEPDVRRASLAAPRLAHFRREWATIVASWVHNDEEAFWLAPRTPPPLTPQKICAWAQSDRQPFALLSGVDEVIGYGEMNILNARRQAYWLGHLIIAPELRGQGLGRELTRLLIERAFNVCGARTVTLVVFEENQSAVAAYRAAGLNPDGHEDHFFPDYNRTIRLLRMTKSALR